MSLWCTIVMLQRRQRLFIGIAREVVIEVVAEVVEIVIPREIVIVRGMKWWCNMEMMAGLNSLDLARAHILLVQGKLG